MLIDTIRRVATPEGVELTLRIAGPVPRAFAWGIDFLIRGALALGLLMGLAYFGQAGMGIFLILYFLIEWFYPVGFEVWRGATPGKKAMGLVVLHDDGTPINLAQSVTRNLLRAVDFLPFLYTFGLITMLLSHDAKRLGDLAAGSIVVYVDRAPPQGAQSAVAAVAPTLTLKPAEARAIIDFAARTPSLSTERADELARTLPHLVGTHGNPVQVLHGIAAHERGANQAGLASV